jgi:hypothetical protein
MRTPNRLDGEPWKIDHRIVGQLSRRASLRIVGLRGTELDFSFAQYGGGIVHVHSARQALPQARVALADLRSAPP